MSGLNDLTCWAFRLSTPKSLICLIPSEFPKESLIGHQTCDSGLLQSYRL